MDEEGRTGLSFMRYQFPLLLIEGYSRLFLSFFSQWVLFIWLAGNAYSAALVENLHMALMAGRKKVVNAVIRLPTILMMHPIGFS